MEVPPLLKNLLAIDVETSGPNAYKHKLLALAIVPVDPTLPTLELFVRHEDVEWTDIARGFFSKYKVQWERNARTPVEAHEKLEDYLHSLHLDDPMFVGHNVGFDFAFVKQLANFANASGTPLVSHRSIDTHTLLQTLSWRGLIPNNACSSSGAFEYLQVAPPAKHRHTALGDAIATRELLLKVFPLLREQPHQAPLQVAQF